MIFAFEFFVRNIKTVIAFSVGVAAGFGLCRADDLVHYAFTFVL